MTDSINNIGCRWDINPSGEYVILDIHHSNFHPGTRKSDSPKFAKIMWRADGTRYIRHGKKSWNLD